MLCSGRRSAYVPSANPTSYTDIPRLSQTSVPSAVSIQSSGMVATTATATKTKTEGPTDSVSGKLARPAVQALRFKLCGSSFAVQALRFKLAARMSCGALGLRTIHMTCMKGFRYSRVYVTSTGRGLEVPSSTAVSVGPTGRDKRVSESRIPSSLSSSWKLARPAVHTSYLCRNRKGRATAVTPCSMKQATRSESRNLVRWNSEDSHKSSNRS